MDLKTGAQDPSHGKRFQNESFEDHVWFKDRWMVASLCDE
jgi:hypothetical protein